MACRAQGRAFQLCAVTTRAGALDILVHAFLAIDALLLLLATWLRVSSRIAGNRDFPIPRLTAPGYTLVNLAANYIVNPYTTVFGRIDNLFDEHYQNPTGFERPGFGIYGGIRVANR